MGILSVTWIQLPAFVLVAYGFYFALRVLRFPDLTVEAAFTSGVAGAAWGAIRYDSAFAGLAFGIALGGFAGLLTSSLYAINRTPLFKLLASLLVLTAFYSVNLRVTGGQADVSLVNSHTFVNELARWESRHEVIDWQPARPGVAWGIVALVVCVASVVMRSEVGIIYRIVGYRASIAEACGRRSVAYVIAGLVIVNAIVAVAGWISAFQDQNANLNQFGLVLHALAAVILGEVVLGFFVVRLQPLMLLLLTPLVGALIYTLLRGSVIYWVSTIHEGDSGFFSPRIQDLNLLIASFLAVVIIASKLISASGNDATLSEADSL
jgi:putative ABC transport system permease protein